MQKVLKLKLLRVGHRVDACECAGGRHFGL
jgi:hypothetical protein